MKLRTTLFRRLLGLTFMVLLALAGCTDSMTGPEEEAAAPAAPTFAKMRHAHLYGGGEPGKILNRFEDLATHTEFVVGFAEPVLDMQRILERYSGEEGVTLKRSYSKVLKGMALSIEPAHVERILNRFDGDGEIAWVEPDPKYNHGISGKTFKLPRSQQLVSSLNMVGANNTSTNPGDGKGSVDVDIYILDTGVAHEDINVVERIDFTASGQELDMTRVYERMEAEPGTASDAFGHGTHVAGIAAAIDDDDYLVGVAPGARIHDFKVFNEAGQADMSSVIAALDVIRARKLLSPLTPVVVNLSLGADVGTSQYNALDEAIVAAIEAGVVVVVAAGNDSIDASTVTPAHVAEAITVGSTRRGGSKGKTVNVLSTFSNYGPAIDLFAHGEAVESLSSNPTVTLNMTGTSMAAPLVTGVVALYLSQNPLATPQQVRQVLLDAADSNVGEIPAGTPNRYLDASSF